jgi:hypothetical protein
MTVQSETFYEYIIKFETENTKQFRSLFESDIPQLPNRVSSSIAIRKHLHIDSIIKEKVFQAVFLDYFKNKVYNSL